MKEIKKIAEKICEKFGYPENVKKALLYKFSGDESNNKDINFLLKNIHFDTNNVPDFITISNDNSLSDFFLLYRLLKCYVALSESNHESFKLAVTNHDKLTRYISDNKFESNLVLINHESLLIKYGNVYFGGKTIDKKKFKTILQFT